MDESVIRDVPDTAFMVAMDRALESERPDALFHDPFAAKLAGDRGKEIAEWRGERAAVGRWSVVMRTVIIDDFVRAAVARGVDAIVNLGAGLDARPYRLDLPASLAWVEVDFPSIVTHKAALLAADRPTCALERIALDLSQAEARRELLCSLALRFENVLVLTEGVVPYLTVEDVGALADELKAAANVREWIVDYFSPETLRFRRESGGDFTNAPFKFEPDDWHAFFASHGWRAREERYLLEEGQRRHRAIPISEADKAAAIARVGSGGLRDPAKFAGYFLMEPA